MGWRARAGRPGGDDVEAHDLAGRVRVARTRQQDTSACAPCAADLAGVGGARPPERRAVGGGGDRTPRALPRRCACTYGGAMRKLGVRSRAAAMKPRGTCAITRGPA